MYAREAQRHLKNANRVVNACNAIERTAALPSLHLQVSRQQQRRVEAKRGGLGFHGVQRPIIANRVISAVDCADQHAVPPRRRKATAATTTTTTLQSLSLSIDGSWCWIQHRICEVTLTPTGLGRSADGFICFRHQEGAAVDWFCSHPQPDESLYATECLPASYVSSNPCEADWLQPDSSSCHESFFSFPFHQNYELLQVGRLPNFHIASASITPSLSK